MTKEDWKARREVSKKNSEKYKYVRFVEMKKVTKKIRHLRDELVKAVSQKIDTSDLEKQLVEAQENMVYVQRFPLDEKYISLFPSTPLTDEALKRQQELKDKIKNRKSNRDALEARVAAKKAGSKVVTDDFFDSGKKVVPVKKVSAKPGSEKKPFTKTSDKTVKPRLPQTFKPRTSAPHPEVRPVQISTQAAGNHPSWAAKADPKQKGTLAGFEGNRKTFDDDD